MGDEFITKYSQSIQKCVKSFCRKYSGFGNTSLIDRDDLYQECVAYLFEKYLKSGKTLDDFGFTSLELKHVMCASILKCLPISVPCKDTSNYTKFLRQYAVDFNTDEHADMLDNTKRIRFEDDADFMINYRSFFKTLPNLDSMIFQRLMNGIPHKDIMKEFGISRGTLRCIQKRLARNWNIFMAEENLYYGRKA